MEKLIFILPAFLFLSCTTSTIREKINQAGDVAGQVSGEFAEGVRKGVEKAFDVTVELTPGLSEKGIRFGKTTVSDDSTGTGNLLTVYVIFDKDFSGELTAKAYDSKSAEMGRKTVQVRGKASESQFIEFHFDKRTNIDSDSKLVIE